VPRLSKRAKAERRSKQAVKVERLDKMTVNVNVDGKVFVLNEKKHPLEFSVQLKAEERAAACRAPVCVLATSCLKRTSLFVMDKKQSLLKPVVCT